MAVDPILETVEFAKVWVPLISAFMVSWKVYSGAKENIVKFADKLLTNHLHHIQESLDSQTDLLKKLVERLENL